MSSSMILNLSARLGLDGASDLKKEVAGLADNIKKSFGDAYSAARDSGLTKKSLAVWEKEATRIEGSLKHMRTAGDRKRFMENEKEFKREHTRVLQLTSRRQKAAVDLKNGMQSDFEALTDGFATGLGSAIGNAVSLNFAGLGNQLKGLGKKAKMYGGKKAGEEGSAKGIGKWAPKIIKLLGTIAMKIGMTAGIIGLLIAGMGKAIDAGRQLNKTLTDGGASAGDFASNTNTLHESLENVKKAFPVKRNLAWMQTTKEAMEILGAWNSVGHTFKDMGDGLKDQTVATKNYQKAVETATTYAKLFGTTGSEMATNMGSYMEDLGYSLDGIREKFSQVYKVASQSSFGTKRFFGMVLQATSGMAMYNVRINETAAIMLNLSKLLGAQKGKEEAGKAAKGSGRKDSSQKDRIVETKKRGVKRTQEIMKAGSANMGDAFQDIMKTRKPKEKAAMAKAFADVGIKDLAALSGEKLAQAMSELTTSQASALQFAAKQVDPALRGNLVNLRGASLGRKGGLGAVAASTQFATGSTAELLDVTKGQKLMRGKTLGQVSETKSTEMIAAATLSGESGEAMLISKQKDQNARALLAHTKKSQKKLAKLEGDEKAKAIKEYNQGVGKGEGTVMDAKGRVFRGQSDEEGSITSKGKTELKDFDSIFMSQGQGMGEGDGKGEDLGKQVSEDIRLAQETAHNTEDITKGLKILGDGVMEKIYRGIMDIYYFVMGDAKKLKKDAIQISVQESEKLTKEIDKAKELEGKLEKRIRKDPKNDEARRSLAKVKRGRMGLEKMRAKEDNTRRNLNSMSDDDVDDTKASVATLTGLSLIPGKAAEAVASRIRTEGVQTGDDLYRVMSQRTEDRAGKEDKGKYEAPAARFAGGSATPEDTKALLDMGKEQLRQTVSDAIELEKGMKESDRHMTRMMKDVQPEEMKKVLLEVYKEEKKDDLIGKLMEAGKGGADARRIAESLVEGKKLDTYDNTFVKENKGTLGSFAGMDRVEDFIWRPGQGVTRISAKDVIMGGKPGGPMASAGGGGGGGGQVINHFYNDSKGFLANQAKMKRAMSGHA